MAQQPSSQSICAPDEGCRGTGRYCGECDEPTCDAAVPCPFCPAEARLREAMREAIGIIETDDSEKGRADVADVLRAALYPKAGAS